MISGAAYVVKALQEEQVDILFNYPGAATIDIMDELYKQDKVKVILPRHEQALAHAADGYARSTGVHGNLWTRCYKPCDRYCDSIR